ncbi:MAG TPA: MobF family relaxase [Terracidiphilus sp.]|jgi:conjugative relaxase-like TrwC/TraI family protein
MLTISKPLSAGQARNYHAKEFTSPEQSYWSRGQTVESEWQGRLAQRYGLVGRVGVEEFAHLSEGRHPVTGDQLVRHRQSHEYKTREGKTIQSVEHRAGWDATFSAPKSVSLTALVGGDERVSLAHRAAVAAALTELERFTQARIGGNHPSETTGLFVTAKFEHDTARPVDGYAAPQLHTHAIIFNMTEREDGTMRALQPQSLFESQQFATAVYQSELMYRLRNLGYEIQSGKSGAPEIRGYSQEYLDASSPRSQQIREYLDRTGHNGREAAEIAAHSTRDRKEIHSLDEVMAAHRRLAAQYGHQADAVVRAAREHALHPVEDPQQPVREAVTFSRDKNFEREAVVDERLIVRDALRRGMGEITYAQVRRHLAARLASGEFQTVALRHAPGRQFTTARTIEAEREILRHVQVGHRQVQPATTRSEAHQITDRNPHLNCAQKSVVEDVLSSPDRIQGIQGWAGSGKTSVLRIVGSAVEANGYEVQGFAPTSRAARQLREAGIAAGTLQGFLARARSDALPERRSFYFVDESSLASTNQIREFLGRLGPHDRVLLIGDIRQHQAVEAGRPFEQLQRAGMHTAHLDQIVRQKDPALKSAVELLATGRTAVALESLQRQGRVREIPDHDERIRTIARTYAESPADTLIVSPDNASRRELNLAVREELKASGAVSLKDHSFRILVQRQEMTGADRAWANHYEIGDAVHYTRGSRSMGIQPGSYATVIAIHPNANLLRVETQSGESAIYDPRRLRGVSVYRDVSHEFAPGDRIRFSAPDKVLRVSNHDLAIIESIANDGRVVARLDDQRRIEFNAAEYRHFDHGYAVTSHCAQGLTAERVPVNANTGVHPDLLNSRFGYVSISRASLEATVFTDDAARLSQQLGTEITKTSAIEVGESASIGQGLSMM